MNENRFQSGRRVSVWSLVGNAFLTVAKLAAGVVGNSSAMIADAVHSASDFASTAGVLVSLRISSKPADSTHPYGHGRAESIMAKLLAIMLVGMGTGTAWTAVGKLLSPDLPVPGDIALWAAAISIASKEIMYRYTIKVGKQINSSAIVADAWHHRSDAFSSVVALVGIGGAHLGLPVLDPLAGLAVAVVVIKVGVDIIRTSVSELMDSQPPQEVISEVRRAAGSVQGVCNIGTLAIRTYGPKRFVDVSVCVDGTLSVKDGHLIADRVKERILSEFGDVADVMVHIDPCTANVYTRRQQTEQD